MTDDLSLAQRLREAPYMTSAIRREAADALERQQQAIDGDAVLAKEYRAEITRLQADADRLDWLGSAQPRQQIFQQLGWRDTEPIREAIDNMREVATSNSYRRIVARPYTPVCEPIKQNGGHPDLYFRNGGPEGPDARLIAAAPTLLKHRDALLEALTELVACKDLHDRIDANDASLYSIADAERNNELQADYDRRKPLAWERARTLLAEIRNG